MNVTRTSTFEANYFKKLALKQNKKLASIPLKDKSAAKILTGENSMDCYIIRDGKLQEASGFATHDEGNFLNQVSAKLEKLQRIALDGIDVVAEWGASLQKNVKDL